jgi:catechol 2,3-dioxygenase-like lactoylglutathione lyase family enzyme
MPDIAVPNLPSRDFSDTATFYSALGFECAWRDENWMILERGTLLLEFFPHPTLDPTQSWFSCCLRLDDLGGFYAALVEAGVPEMTQGVPRIQPPQQEPSGRAMGALVDPDGSLLRLIQN